MQGASKAWKDMLLPGAKIVAQGLDPRLSVIAHEGAAWNGVWITGYPEYQSTIDGNQTLYNALLWSAGYLWEK